MNTMHDLEATTYAPTTQAPRGDDHTVASAWSSSPLGDPADHALYADEGGCLADGYDFSPLFPPRFSPTRLLQRARRGPSARESWPAG